MKLSDALKSKRADLIDRLEKLAKAAEHEDRLFTETEQAAWDAGQAEIKNFDAKLKGQLEAEELLRGGPAQPVPGTGPGLIAADGTVLRALRREDKLVDLLPRGVQRQSVSIGAVLRGIVHGDWRGVGKPLERAVGVTGDSIFPVPESISNEWIDMARAASVAFQAGAITIPMRTMTERIVAVTQDPVFTFRREHKPIPESEILLSAIDLKAKLCGAIVRTSIELLEDSPIANDLIQQVMINKAAQMIDWALVAGDDSTTGDLENPLGLLHWPGVPRIDAVVPPINYDQLIDAYASVLTANGVPNAMITGAAMMATFAKIRSGYAGDQTTSSRPSPSPHCPSTSPARCPLTPAWLATSRCWRGDCARA
jgi:HK97 family phage major capsid protein